jgi:hypothetical protein
MNKLLLQAWSLLSLCVQYYYYPEHLLTPVAYCNFQFRLLKAF